MEMDKENGEQKPTYRYHRRSIRLPNHDYRAGTYFVTVRASTHDPIFEFPALHTIVQDMWDALPQRFPGVKLDAFVIMLDHIHGILWLNGSVENAPTLGRVIGAFKSLVIRHWIDYCNTAHIYNGGSFWLERFYEEVIENKHALQTTRRYIRENPAKLDERQG